ncbi:MAG: PPC domain-containing DNA-binding protein [Pseudomonadota bacterium]
MTGKGFQLGRLFMERLPYEGDLLKVLNAFCREEQIKTGYLSVIGAAKCGVFSAYNQGKQVYETVTLKEELEITNCQGNVSLLEGEPFVHAHISFSRADGQTLAGHLMEGTILFAGELVLREFLGPDRIRRKDPVTGLNLWAL